MISSQSLVSMPLSVGLWISTPPPAVWSLGLDLELLNILNSSIKINIHCFCINKNPDITTDCTGWYMFNLLFVFYTFWLSLIFCLKCLVCSKTENYCELVLPIINYNHLKWHYHKHFNTFLKQVCNFNYCTLVYNYNSSFGNGNYSIY